MNLTTIEVGQNALVTTDAWFYAPDGQQYRAVWGTVHAVLDDQESLGIKTNRNASNWYLSIGNMLIAGCQIHYAIRTDTPPAKKHIRSMEHEGKVSYHDDLPHIYNANEP